MTNRPEDDDPDGEQFLALLRQVCKEAEATHRQHSQTGQRLGYVVQSTDQFCKDYETLTILPRDEDILKAMKGGLTIAKQLKDLLTREAQVRPQLGRSEPETLSPSRLVVNSEVARDNK